ncbi:MAG: hypothetical protein C0180_04220 [Aciduliprofundum sp.]|nr:MAG: hypothetical protein C0180_04220 [Aciduliprofundum sp.]
MWFFQRGNVQNNGGIYDATINIFNRLGSTNTTLAIAYFNFKPITPDNLDMNGLNIYLNESPMKIMKGDYHIHYPTGNGISQVLVLPCIWITTESGDGFIALFPYANNVALFGYSQLDLIYANINMSGNTVQLRPAYFPIDSWIGVGLGVGYSDFSYIATDVIGLTNYVDGMWLKVNYWTNIQGKNATLHITTNNYTYNNGHVLLPLDFRIVDLRNYDVLIDYSVNLFNSPSEIVNSVPSSYGLINSSLRFNCKNNTEFGYSDSIQFTMNFSNDVPYSVGNDWGFEICYGNNVVTISTIIPP